MNRLEIHDTCQSAADVLARARAVHRHRIAARRPRPVPIEEVRMPAVTVHITARREPPELDASLRFAILVYVLNLLAIAMGMERRGTIAEIQRIVADHFDIDRKDMFTTRRTKNVVLPRQIAMYLAKRLTVKSLPEIGRRFGGRDHTTVLHAVNRISGMLEADLDLALQVAAIKMEIETAANRSL